MTYYTPLIILIWLALIVFCILVRENDRFSREMKRIMYLTYLIVAAAALSEWLGVRMNGNPAVSPGLLRAVKYFDYVLTPMAGGAIVLQFQTKSVWRKVLFTILALNTVFQTVSLFTGWMITIDAGNTYSHGPGYNVYIGFYLIIILLVIFEFGSYGSRFRKKNRVSLYSTLILTVVGIAMQEILGGEVRTAYVALVICLAVLFIHNSEFELMASDDRIQEQMIRISVDPLTGISSRNAYNTAMTELASLDSLPGDLVAFSIDINGLKTTNDTYGHHAGDELICAASDCISAVFAPFGTCYRTGGDEFIVLTHLEDRALIPALEGQLESKADAWHGKEAPSLSLSVGSADASDYPGVSAEKLVSIADQEMYKMKAAYYRAAGIDRRKRDEKSLR